MLKKKEHTTKQIQNTTNSKRKLTKNTRTEIIKHSRDYSYI